MIKNMTEFKFDGTREIDILTVGRVAIDLYSEQVGGKLRDVQTFRKYLGGSPGNIAFGCSRLGLKSAILSRVGDDEMGEYLKNVLTKEGVDTSLLQIDKDRLTALVLLGICPPDHFPLMFYRENCADNHIEFNDSIRDYLKKTKSVLISGTALAHPLLRETTKQVIKEAKTAGCALLIDIDYRPVLWGLTKPGDGESRFVASDAVTNVIKETIGEFDLIVGTQEEFKIASGSETDEESVSTLQSLVSSDTIIVLKTGEKGCTVYNGNNDESYVSEPFPVKVLNVLGAGDAFFSGFLRGWLRNETIEQCTRYANANGALVVTRVACSPASASYDELCNFMSLNDVSLFNRKNEMPVVAHQKGLFILAYDHRVQFEKSCEKFNKEFHLISEFKNLVYEGFLQIKSKEKFENLGVIIDPKYGQSVIESAAKKDISIGMPIEEAGIHPIEWLGDLSVYEEIMKRPANSFIKVLWKYHPDCDESEKKYQINKMKELYQVTGSLSRPLMLELIIPEFYETNGHSLSLSMEEVYDAGIFPEWWKIAPVDSVDEWNQIQAVINKYDPKAKIIILGQNAEITKFENWFRVANNFETIVGFAIGRTIFWHAWEEWIQGKYTNQDVIDEIKDRFETILKTWMASSKSSVYI